MSVEQIWRLKPLACTQFIVALVISFEAGDAVERALVLPPLTEFDSMRSRLLKDALQLKWAVLAMARALTGRDPRWPAPSEKHCEAGAT